jgi:hypothetical protein
MTNPLLQPDDRFRRPTLLDQSGRSLFGEENSPAKIENTVDADNPLPAVPVAGPSYQPTFQTILPDRSYSITWLSIVGFAFTCSLILPFVSIYVGYGIIFGCLGIILSVVAVLQAYEELSGISLGAIDARGRNTVIIAYCLALSGVVIGVGVILWVLIMVMYGVLDLNL